MENGDRRHLTNGSSGLAGQARSQLNRMLDTPDNIKGVTMALIFVVERESQADFNVFVTDRESHADICVFIEKHESRAKGDSIWYMTEREYRASSKVYFAQRESQADLIVCFVQRESQAKWKKSHRLFGQI